MKKANNLLMFLNFELIKKSRLLFFGCVFTLDLYLLQAIVLLNLCFKFSKNLILSINDNFTIGHKLD